MRNWCAKKHHGEGMVGKSTRSVGEEKAEQGLASKRWGFVQPLETQPQRRLYEGGHAPGVQMNQDMPCLSAGNDTLRALQREMRPPATPLLACFPLTLQLPVWEQYGKGLVQCEAALGEAIREKIARLQGALGHGQVAKALGKIDDLASAIAPFRETSARFNPLVKALAALRTYRVNTRPVIPD